MHVHAVARARALDRLGRTRQAMEELERYLGAFTLFGRRAKASGRLLHANLLFRDGRFEEAVKECAAVIAVRPGPRLEAIARQELANSLRVLGREKEARDQFRFAVELLARDRRNLGFKEEAEARLLEEEGDRRRAIASLEEAIGKARRTGEWRRHLLLKLAQLQGGEGYYRTALHTAREILSDRTALPDEQRMAHRISALALGCMGNSEAATEHWLEALRISTMLSNPEQEGEDHTGLGREQQREGDFVKAMGSFDQGSRLSDRVRLESFTAQGDCLFYWGRYEEALEMYDRALTSDPGPLADEARLRRTSPLVGAAMSLYEQGNLDRAWQRLEEIELRNPALGRARSWVMSVRAMVAAARGSDETRTLIEQARNGLKEFEHDPVTQCAVNATLGRALYHLGEFEESVECFRVALANARSKPDLPGIHYYMGEALESAGHHEEARAAWQAAAEVGLPVAGSFKARRRLKESQGT